MNLVTAGHRNLDDLTSLAQQWQALWQRVPGAMPFQHPAWLIAWWEVFAPGDLFVISAWREGRLVGMAPLYREVGKLGERILPLGISVSDYLDLLLHPDYADAAGEALIAHLLRADLPWSEWELPELSAEASALRLTCPPALADEQAPQSICPMLTLPRTIDGLSEVIPSRKRRKLRMARNRAGRRSSFAIERVTTGDVDEAFTALFKFHRARWHHDGETGVLADPRARAFHRTTMARLNDAGIARIYRLTLEGQTAGIYYGFLSGTEAYAYLGGFSCDCSFESPGTLLIGHAIEEAVREGAQHFHFLRGDEAYKFEWGATEQWTVRRVLRRVAADALA